MDAGPARLTDAKMLSIGRGAMRAFLGANLIQNFRDVLGRRPRDDE